MTHRTSIVSLILILAFFFASIAQAESSIDPVWVDQLSQQGWQPVGEGLLRTELPDGTSRLMAYNAAGLRVAIAGLEERLFFVTRRHLENPSESSQAVATRYLALIDKLQRRIDEGWTASPIVSTKNTCDFTANAWISKSGCTQTSNALATYDGTCFGKCSTHTFVYIKRRDCLGNEDDDWHFCDSDEGNNVSCSGSLSSSSLWVYHSKTRSCEAYAEAYLDCQFGLNFPEDFDYTSSCPFKCGLCKEEPEELPIDPTDS